METDIEIKKEEGEALPVEEPIRKQEGQNKKKCGKAHSSLRATAKITVRPKPTI
jgi:hypothetical protein